MYMKKFNLTILLILIFASLIFLCNYISFAYLENQQQATSPIQYNALKPGIDYKKGEILVKFKKPQPESDVYFLTSNMESYSLLKVENLFSKSNAPPIFKNKLFLVKVNREANIEQACKELMRQKWIEYAEPNYIYHHTSENPTDPFFDKLWGIRKIKVDKVWNITEGSEDIVVAVIDTGCDLNHEDLKHNLVPGKNFVDSGNPIDTSEHGTHVAGIIAAMGNNNKGIIGLAPKCKIMPLKVGPGPTIFTLAAVKAITYAADNEVSIINMSWGGPYNSLALNEAIKYAYSKDVVLVAAAGNNNDNVNNYVPAKYSETIAVAATDINDQRAKFSNYGEDIDISAPGVGILSSIPGNNYKYFKGTSMAAPHVAGLAALIRSINPELSNEKVRKIIKSTADKIATDKPVGTGRINATKAITSVKSEQETNPISSSKPVAKVNPNSIIDPTL